MTVKVKRLTLVVNDVEEQGGKQAITVLRLRDPRVVERGFRFQRCGGGRRVIKKQRGGA